MRVLAVGRTLFLTITVWVMLACAGPSFFGPEPQATPSPSPAPAALLPCFRAKAPGFHCETGREQVRIGLPATTLAHLPIYVAKAIGTFERHGLDVELSLVRPPLQIAALQNAEIEYITTTGIPLSGALAGYDVKIVGVSLPGPLFQWVTRPQIGSVQDLRGRRLGVNSVGTTDHQIVTAVLRKYGLEDAVTVLGLGDTPILAEALRSGAVDAASMSPPWPAKLRREGYPILLNVSAELDIPQAGLATTTARLVEYRDQVKRVLRAEIEAIRYIQANRAETMAIIAQTFGMDAATAEESYESVAPAFRAAMRPSEEGIFNLATEVLASAGQVGALTVAEIYERAVDPRPVEEVQAELGIR